MRPSSRRRAPAPLAQLACLALLSPCYFRASASAATYVEPSAESRALVGVALSTGTVGDRELGVAGAGVELESGWAWEHGLSLAATFGETRHARGDALTVRLGLLDARATDDAVGLRGRFTVTPGAFAPFVQGALTADRVRFSGEREGSALGASAALGVGLRWREAPWELALSLDARRTWIEAPFADLDALAVDRLVASLGVRLDW
jgi:hypothetical protein